jgi:hypothetical protein
MSHVAKYNEWPSAEERGTSEFVHGPALQDNLSGAVSLCVYLKISFYEPISCRTRLNTVGQSFSRGVAGDQTNEKKKASMDGRRYSH